MRLSIIVEIDDLSKETAQPIIEAVNSTTNLRVELGPCKRWFRKITPALFVTEDGGCACSMLTDDAGWDAPAWDMRPELLEPLANTVKALYSQVPDGFRMLALWAGDKPQEEIDISLGDFCERIKQSGLGTKTQYRILASESV